MKQRHLLCLAAMTSGAFLSFNVMAADAAGTTTQLQTAPSVRGSTMNSTMPGPGAVGGSERMDNTNPAPLDTWMQDYAATHEGRITRREFLDQMGNRWDTLDAQHHGYLTPDEARGIYSQRQSVRPAMSGSEVTPGYMGPGSSRGK
jgi:hypothetical protein